MAAGRVGKHESRMAYLFISPAMFLFFVFMVVPVGMALFISFTNYDVLSRSDWIGLANYERLIGDYIFWVSFKNVLIFTVIYVPAIVILSCLIALLVNQKKPGMKFFRTMYYMPTVTSAVAASTVWLWLLNPEYGLVNELLSYIGIVGPAWLAQTNTALLSIVVITLWMTVGSNMIIYLAGLQGVPDHLYESAKIDGANKVQRFYYVTWPMLKPVTFFVSTMSIIMALQLFDQAYVLTQGGPANSTKTVVYHIYNMGFNQLQMGYASAQAFILAIVLVVFTFVNLKMNRDGANI